MAVCPVGPGRTEYLWWNLCRIHQYQIVMNNSGTPHPHDSFFKIVMSQPEAARDFLNIHLPPALLAVCDRHPATGVRFIC
ncbi:hypothetical protein EZ821_05685 [Salmonella enterica subsp. enterica serovar Adelaide]|nr:hypothetical protein [Salmonella enterica subsp. enterica serovar Adelaide]ECC9078413.1 hypothetical protein [Salmonella enterica subsp. enterica]EEG3102642.1 Rpn family recombination-promoting nuclease/putative transposase [Salmonella enterica]ECF2138792.1 hypothetical protein [Salmonella enterica subsp. enterica serovar Adelaide]ECG4563442.1 hypothetical protein [Salmonella enterica subsp. enterica serovar Adelaide]